MFDKMMAIVNPGGVAKRAEARLKIAETNMKIDAVKMKKYHSTSLSPKSDIEENRKFL